MRYIKKKQGTVAYFETRVVIGHASRTSDLGSASFGGNITAIS
jgi:hypothetical protein